MKGITIEAAAIKILSERDSRGQFVPKTLNRILEDGYRMGKGMYSFRNRKTEINQRYRTLMGIECPTCDGKGQAHSSHPEHELIHYNVASETYQITGNLPVYLGDRNGSHAMSPEMRMGATPPGASEKIEEQGQLFAPPENTKRYPN